MPHRYTGACRPGQDVQEAVRGRCGHPGERVVVAGCGPTADILRTNLPRLSGSTPAVTLRVQWLLACCDAEAFDAFAQYRVLGSHLRCGYGTLADVMAVLLPP